MGLAGSKSYRTHGASMEGTEETDKVMAFGVKLRQLDGSLNCFGPRVG
jgi:hypothetical protein